MKLGTSTPALGLSAVALAGLILFQLGRDPAPARAEMVSHVGDYAVLTTDAGNEEIFIVVDNRTEDMLIYRVEKQSSVELYKRYGLSRLFADARAAAGGRPR